MKKGFSLIEVMIMFTLLSVILAASMPMITKKANPVQNKISHGVYRCINTAREDGKLLEEQYSGSRQVKSEFVDKCSFNVPKAALYKIDMYSAGTGGTEFAKVRGINDEHRTAHYRLKDGYTKDQNQETNSDLIYTPSESELIKRFNGTYLARTVYTGDAGDGGVGDMIYESPYEADCGVDDLSVVKEKITEYKDLKDKYNNIKMDLSKINSYYNSDIIIAGGDDSMLWCQKGVHWAVKNDGYFNPQEWWDKYCSYTTRTVSNLSSKKIIIPIIPEAENSTEHQMAYKNFCWQKLNGTGTQEIIPIMMNCHVGRIQFYDNVTRVCNAMRDAIAASGKVNTQKLDNITLKVRTLLLYDYSLYSFEPYLKAAAFDGNKDGAWEINNLVYGMTHFPEKNHNGLYINYNSPSSFLGRDGMPPAAISAAAGIWFDDLAKRFETYYNNEPLTDEEKTIIENYEKIADMEKEVAAGNTSLLKNNIYANPVSSTYSFKKAYSDPKLVVNNKVRLQVADFCKIAFRNYYEIKKLDPKNTIKFGQRRVARHGGDGGKGGYSRLVYQLRYDSKRPNTDFSTYLAELVTMGKYGIYPNLSYMDGNEIKNTNIEIHDIYKVANAEQGISVQADYTTDRNDSNKFITKVEGGALHALLAPNFGYTLASRNTTKLAKIINDDENANGPKNWYDPSDCIEGLSVDDVGVDGDISNTTYCDSNSNNSKDIIPDIIPEVPDEYLLTKTYAYLKTTNGADNSALITWSLPTPGKDSRTNALASDKPTGGGGAIVYVSESKASATTAYNAYAPNNPPRVNAYIIFSSNFAYKAGSDTPLNGKNAILKLYSGTGYAIRSFYLRSISAWHNARDTFVTPIQSLAPDASSVIWQEPELDMESNIWRKTYALGQAGKTGNHETFTATDLGHQCTFNVAAPGEPFDYSKNDNALYIKEMNAALTTSMQCTENNNKKNRVIFEKDITNNYEPAVQDAESDYNYSWSEQNEAKGEHTVGNKVEVKGKIWKPTSLWAKIFNKYEHMQSGGDYDLTSKGVGQAGAGTTLQDRCLARRGSYTTKMFYNLKYLYIQKDATKSPEIDFELHDPANPAPNLTRTPQIDQVGHTRKLFNTESAPYETGNVQGFNCYGVPSQEWDNPDLEEAEMDITKDSNINKKGLMKISAGKGGGGAVVITW